MTIIKCDVCGDEYDVNAYTYHINVASTDGDSNYRTLHLFYDVCPCCATRVLNFINSIRYEGEESIEPESRKTSFLDKIFRMSKSPDGDS